MHTNAKTGTKIFVCRLDLKYSCVLIVSPYPLAYICGEVNDVGDIMCVL